ncbi:MAG: hypothetical protein WD314_15680, partial [Trueperaceae bacterium]
MSRGRMDMDFLFDLDGTLVDRSRSVLEFVPRQFARFSDSSKNDGEEFARRFLELDANGYGDKGLLYQTLCAEFQLSAGAEELLQDFRARCFEAVHLQQRLEPFSDDQDRSDRYRRVLRQHSDLREPR